MSSNNVSCYFLSSSNSFTDIFKVIIWEVMIICNYCSDSYNVISIIREIVMVSCLVVVIVKVILWDIIIIVFIVWVVIFVIVIA